MRALKSAAVILLAIMLSSLDPISKAAGLALQGGGTVLGEIKFTDAVPKPEKLLMNRDADTCGVTKTSEAFLVSPKSKGLKNVVLSVEGVADLPKLQQNPLSLRIVQKGCVYDPHVQVGVLGATLEIVNVDPVLHNIHAYLEPSKKTLFNLAQPIQNQVSKVVLKEEGVINVKCDVHRWMSAFVIVKKHPYVTVSDENGLFRINNVPPGRYTLHAWHEELGSIDKEVTVTAGTEARVDFEIGK